jgi:hypothetical protein
VLVVELPSIGLMLQCKTISYYFSLPFHM